MKKVSAFLCFGALIFGMTFNNVFATKDYQVHVAVFCEDEKKGNELVKSMCHQKSALTSSENKVIFTGEKNDSDCSTVVYDGTNDANYHVDFHVMSKVDTTYNSNCRNLLSKCSEAIILYDISDNSLETLIRNRNLSSENIKALLSSKTPLTRFIDKLQYKKCWVFPGWYNSIDFISYGKENLPEEIYDQRRDIINRFTCTTEKYFGVDNRWRRGHPDISSPDFYEGLLFGVIGSSYRSITDGFISGTYIPETQHKGTASDLLNKTKGPSKVNNPNININPACSYDDAQVLKKK